MSDAIKIIGVTVGTPQNPEKITKGYVPESRKIAGLELSEDITGEELRDALDIMVHQTIVTGSEHPVSSAVIHNLVQNIDTNLRKKANAEDVPDVDQSYTKGSTNAQSATAVAEAISLLSVRPDVNYMPESAAALGRTGLEKYAMHAYKTGNSSGSSMSVKVTIQMLKDVIVGDIDTALDELHTYAQSLISGGATE